MHEAVEVVDPVLEFFSSVVAFSVVAFSVVAFSVIAFSVVAFSVIAFSVIAFSVVAFSIVAIVFWLGQSPQETVRSVTLARYMLKFEMEGQYQDNPSIYTS
jgi:hypothetical protein